MNSRLDAYAGARAVITGGLGLIGSAIARRLVALGAEVLLVDSMIPEYGGNPANIADIRDRVSVNIAEAALQPRQFAVSSAPRVGS